MRSPESAALTKSPMQKFQTDPLPGDGFDFATRTA
jgi:hypothetical protein